jgi:hypothetical protein
MMGEGDVGINRAPFFLEQRGAFYRILSGKREGRSLRGMGFSWFGVFLMRAW